MGLSFAEKAVFRLKSQISPRLSTKIQNILIWCMRIKQNLHLAIDRSEFILLRFSFRFSRSFYSRYLLRFVFFLAAVKSRVLIMGKSVLSRISGDI